MMKETEINSIETINKIVEMAFISGVIGLRIWFQIKSGKVVCPGPATNCVIVKSSNDTIKARAVPEAIPGMSNGSVMRLKACHGVA